MDRIGEGVWVFTRAPFEYSKENFDGELMLFLPFDPLAGASDDFEALLGLPQRGIAGGIVVEFYRSRVADLNHLPSG